MNLQALRSVSVGLGLRTSSLLRMYPPCFPVMGPTGRRWDLAGGSRSIGDHISSRGSGNQSVQLLCEVLVHTVYVLGPLPLRIWRDCLEGSTYCSTRIPLDLMGSDPLQYILMYCMIRYPPGP